MSRRNPEKIESVAFLVLVVVICTVILIFAN